MSNTMQYEPVIGIEVHAELQTASKMFCSCPVVDSIQAAPNAAVCPVCAGMPGTLPVLNQKAVEFGLRVALALECEIQHTSIFARKNYFYPDLPKGYQISQYEQPLAVSGKITILTPQGEKVIRIRRVHLEEDTGKLTHVQRDGQEYSLVDLNRAGVPLLEIVTEPDFHSAQEVRIGGETLRRLLRCLSVNSGDLEKGVMRIEPNISVRPLGAGTLGTKVEIKNLNSFRALERGVAYEIDRHIALLNSGGTVMQETVGWDQAAQATFSQRTKEDAHDYRYFPEPDLPPLVVDDAWIESTRQSLPELPLARYRRYINQYNLPAADADQLSEEQATGDYFERVVEAGPVPVRVVANWILGELFALLHESGLGIDSCPVSPKALAELLGMVTTGEINQLTGKSVLAEMFAEGKSAGEIVAARGLAQVSDANFIARLVTGTLAEYPDEVASYKAGKLTVANFLFGQVMKKAGGKANPQVVREELKRLLSG
jgi:aspartyl-tRNA(Asn)/glutamyl-tRNA(Gln) amidotransferase subunit B